MAELTTKDFEGLTVPQFREKLKDTESVAFLSQLEAYEQSQEDPRKGVLDAINKRQGELIEPESGVTGEVEAEATAEVSTNDGGEAVGETDSEPATEKVVEEVEDWVNKVAEVAPEEEQPVEEQPEEKVDYAVKIKELRVEIDRISGLCKGHFRIGPSAEDSLFKAKAWLGKLLGSVGNENPYNVGKVTNAKDIPATAEKNQGREFDIEVRKFGLKNTIEAIQELRDMIEKVSDEIDELSIVVESRYQAIFLTQTFVNLSEARFSLGLELAKHRIG